MIGILGGIGRVVGREVAEEALGRIIAGRTAEDLFAREEIARRIGKASFDALVKKFNDMKDERIMDDAKKKESNMNKKMDDFARNMNRNFRNRNSTLYSEVRNIGNKERLEDSARIKECI